MEEKSSHLNKVDFKLFFVEDSSDQRHLKYFNNNVVFYFFSGKYDRIYSICEKIDSKNKFFIFYFSDLNQVLEIIDSLSFIKIVCIENIFDFVKDRIELFKILTKFYITSKTRSVDFNFIIYKNSTNLQKYCELFKNFTFKEIKIK